MVTFNPLPGLPQTRRVVTGHKPDGIAFFEHDGQIIPVNTLPDASLAKTSLGFTMIHQAQGYPVKIQGSADELDVENLHRSKKGGIICEIVDVPPANKDTQLYFHRNLSMDYVVILKGSITVILDEGVETVLREGDVMVQKGTMHAWKNASSEYCRFLTVVIPSEAVRNENSGEYLESTKIKGLTD